MRHRNTLEWQDLQYSVEIKDNESFSFLKGWRRPKELIVLNKVSGSMQAGNLVAILGPSGAGKTTLLAAISQRLRGNIKGNVLLNGFPIDRKEMSRLTCFLPQFDISIQSLTALEHLFFMCHFKMDKRTTKLEKMQRASDLLYKVGLKAMASTQVSNLSGGERRRLGLAEELVRDPLFIFCDEPTTGLDSFNAYSVIRTLRDLTENQQNNSFRKTLSESMEMQILPHQLEWQSQHTLSTARKGVICSIHQPTSDVFELFTHIILVSSGRIVYQGSADDAYLFFSKLGIYCPRNCNPADFYIKLVADDKTEQNYCDIIQNNYEQETVRMNGKMWKTSSMESLWKDDRFRQISWIAQLYYLLLRSTKNAKRAFYDDFYKTIFLLITAFMFALIYKDVGKNDQSSIQNIQGLLFMFSTEIIFTSSYAVVYEFPSTLPIIRREVGENLYSLSAYYVAQIVRRIPQAFVQSFLFLGVIFSITNIIKNFVTYLSMVLTLSIASLTAISYGFFLSSLFESSRMASEIASPFDLFFLLVGGLYMNINSVPFLKYLSLFFYCNEALSYDYWHNVKSIDCSDISGEGCLRNGSEVLREFSLHAEPTTVLVDYTGLLVIFLVMNVIAFTLVSRYVRKAGYY